MQDRFDIIRSYCAKKRCLDIGTVGDLNHHIRQPEKWLFAHIKSVGADVIGLDLNKEAVDEARELGFSQIYHGNAETHVFDSKFDVITAGEVIEHLNNPGQFLVNVRRNLGRDGLIILTTPNAYAFNNITRAVAGLSVKVFHEHTFTFDIAHLRCLLKNSGYEVVAHYYCTEKVPGIKNFVLRLAGMINRRWGDCLVVVARPCKY